MKSHPGSDRTRAFTLVEMLVVIAIIGILAALLLPVLNQSKIRAKRIWCINDLSQTGIAFHTFANDHSGKFPMAVSINDGGSMEYVQSGFSSGLTFYTAFYHFQVLSNDLVSPRMLVCPVDLRTAAINFQALQNSNLSYFIGATATFEKPESMLAGDRNLATNSPAQPTIMGLGSAGRLWWTWEMHQYKGNILFSDGHVDQWNDPSFDSGNITASEKQSLFLPSVAPVYYAAGPSGGYGSGGPPGGPLGSSLDGSSGGSGPVNSSTQPKNSPMGYQSSQQVSHNVNNRNQTGMAFESASASPTQTAQVYPGAGAAVGADPGMSDFNQKLNRTLQHAIGWGYFWLWLLLLLYLAYRVWKWYQKKDAEFRAQMAQPPPEPFYSDDDDSTV